MKIQVLVNGEWYECKTHIRRDVIAGWLKERGLWQRNTDLFQLGDCMANCGEWKYIHRRMIVARFVGEKEVGDSDLFIELDRPLAELLKNEAEIICDTMQWAERRAKNKEPFTLIYNEWEWVFYTLRATMVATGEFTIKELNLTLINKK